MTLICGHDFDYECIVKWLEIKYSLSSVSFRVANVIDFFNQIFNNNGLADLVLIPINCPLLTIFTLLDVFFFILF